MPLYLRSPDLPLSDLGCLLAPDGTPADADAAAAAAAFLSYCGPSVASGDGVAAANGGGGGTQSPHAAGAAATVPPGSPSLWLLQGESALVLPRGPAAPPGAAAPAWLGSGDATTCVILIVWCPETRAAWGAHLDAAPDAEAMAALRAAVTDHMRRPQAYVVGGYADRPKGEGPRLARAALAALHSLPAPVRVALCCVGAANTAGAAAGGSPRTRQLAVDLASGEARPWGWAAGERGPAVVRRFAAQHVRPRAAALVEVWDPTACCLRLPPFDPVLSSWHTFFMERLAGMGDAQLLANFSTSPDHESRWFCDDMRAMAAWLVAAQEPDSSQRRAAEGVARYCLLAPTTAAGAIAATGSADGGANGSSSSGGGSCGDTGGTMEVDGGEGGAEEGCGGEEGCVGWLRLAVGEEEPGYVVV